ncbi:hypothetical protein MPNT_290004 [Candidatus Methylacidithermus pantelleriae]|uniref:Uncharacterized protein n=1 Tax=Candidatus Methylacidithermus pantelleriae TaxID=2744239 RepID=A0A8J2FST8_9BACT|nr:hypothetical protein MPNT_290004 [Candidatus Methylacidithermus pantelleriae]
MQQGTFGCIALFSLVFVSRLLGLQESFFLLFPPHVLEDFLGLHFSISFFFCSVRCGR